MNGIEIGEQILAVLLNAPDNVDPDQIVIDLLATTFSDAARLRGAHEDYLLLNPNSDYCEWLSNRTGIGTRNDIWQFFDENGWQPPASYDDFQRMVDIATANDPFFQLYHNASGGDWSGFSPPSGR